MKPLQYHNLQVIAKGKITLIDHIEQIDKSLFRSGLDQVWLEAAL